MNRSEIRKFVVPEFIFGSGARLLAGQYARNFTSKKILLVTDEGLIKAGWVDEICSIFKQLNLNYSVFSELTPNPKDYEVMKGAEVYKREKSDLIVALGGGSAMDCAKGIGIVNSNKKHILEFEGVDNVPVPGPPLICIPTTAGTSADVSQFAIINNSVKKVKIAIISKKVVPDVSLIDPDTTGTMDHYLTACTGMDALVHAIEAFVSNANSPVTDLHALEAIRLITSNLQQRLDNMASCELQEKMMLGSLYAGIAFSNASLGAVHAMAHSLGGLLDFAHGEANALLLPGVVNFNFYSVPEKYEKIGKAMNLNMESLDMEEKKSSIISRIKDMLRTSGICSILGEKGMDKKNIPQLAINAMKDPCIVTNPRRPAIKDIERLYEEIF